MTIIRKIGHRIYVLYRNLFYTVEENTELYQKLDSISKRQESGYNQNKRMVRDMNDNIAIMKNEFYSAMVNTLTRAIKESHDKVDVTLKELALNLNVIQDENLKVHDNMLLSIEELIAETQKLQSDASSYEQVEEVVERLVSLSGWVTQYYNNTVEQDSNDRRVMRNQIDEVRQKIKNLDDNLERFDAKREFHINMDSFTKYIVDAAHDNAWEDARITVVDTYKESLGSMRPNVLNLDR